MMMMMKKKLCCQDFRLVLFKIIVIEVELIVIICNLNMGLVERTIESQLQSFL
jgi:hypothetical protein